MKLNTHNINSLKTTTGENEIWEMLFASKQNNTILEGTVKGTSSIPYGDQKVECWMLELGSNVLAFIPQTETTVKDRREFIESIDEAVTYIPLHIDQENGLVLCSQKQAMKVLKSLMIKKLVVDEIYSGVVKRVTPYTLMVEMAGERFTVRRDQLGLLYKNLMELYSVGDTIQLKVTEIDQESEIFKITPVKQNKYLLLGKKYVRKGRYAALIKRQIKSGYVVELEPGLDMFCNFPANWSKDGFPKEGDRVLVGITYYKISDRKVAGHIHKKLS